MGRDADGDRAEYSPRERTGHTRRSGERIAAAIFGVADRVGFYLPYGHDDELVGEVIAAVRASA